MFPRHWFRVLPRSRAPLAQALDSFPRSEDVQIASLLNIVSLSVKPEHRPTILRRRGLERVLESMGRLPGCLQVQGETL